jgi:oligopeptide/dipeptide ABC transporter ATP-binding protein
MSEYTERVMEKILAVRNLSIEFYKGGKIIQAVRDVSLCLKRNEVLGIVGESGCGKSTLALSILKLIPEKEGKIVSGEILFKGEDILRLSNEKLLQIRGNRISIIFQDPFTSLNPLFRIGSQIAESLALHRKENQSMQTEKEIIKLLQLVKMPKPEDMFWSYPHQLSGGMQQRVMIAIALSSNPEILIADEPTTALDVTIQKEILGLLTELQKEMGLSIILITHDFGIVAQTCQRVSVMYAGSIVEEASTSEIFRSPLHPYTKGLLDSLPSREKLSTSSQGEKRRLKAIPGQVPDPSNLPSGCKFYPRCPMVIEDCKSEEPRLKEIVKNHHVRCIRATY